MIHNCYKNERHASLKNLLKCSWIRLRTFMLNLLSTMLMANPLLPNRPVRPILCRYVSLSGLPSLSTGRSKLITTDTCSTSIPVDRHISRRDVAQNLVRMVFNAYRQQTYSPLAQTLVVTRTFSLPTRKRSITAALCSTCISPLSSATWWPSLESSPANHPAVFLVWDEKIHKL